MFGRPVEVWLTRVPTRAAEPSTAETSLLTPGERARRAAMSFPDRRAEYTVGRALVRRMLGARLGLPPHRVPLGEDVDGRPFLIGERNGRPRYDFNLSHSGTWLALAVSSGLRVGVDIEQVVARGSDRTLARRYFTESERALLSRGSPRRYPERWYRIWTTREAHAKARGVGIRGLADPMDGHGIRWQRRSLPVSRGYAGSVVALAPTSRHDHSPTTDTRGTT
ncbi:4'-phosphopantetheinyl transferase family protein [Streptomyces sp. NPDC054765]